MLTVFNMEFYKDQSEQIVDFLEIIQKEKESDVENKIIVKSPFDTKLKSTYDN